MTIDRRDFLKATAATMTGLTVLRGRAVAQPKPVRIGYTLSATGPYSLGAGIQQAPNYVLWQERVNAQGGLLVKGEGRRPVEYISTDDRSELETAVRFYEKLCADDKVDLLLPPWGTAMHFAVAPIANKYGYPLLGPTVTSMKLKDLGLPYFYALLAQPDAMMGAVVALFKQLAQERKISKVGVAYVNDLFGIEMFNAALPLLKDAGLEPVETKSYALGVKDLSPVIKSLKAKGVDAFLGLTYPPDTILATAQSKEADFSPPVFLTAVGTAFPIYRDRFKGAEGVMGVAGWNRKVKFPGAAEYFEAFVKRHNREPDRWGTAFAYASLQILETCVAEVGLDRKRIKDMLDTTEFMTVVGPVKFVRGLNVSTPGMVSQWQQGEFEIIWPRDRATGAPVVPKPAWAF